MKPGTYTLTGPISLPGPQNTTSRAVLRGETDDPADVIIDANGATEAMVLNYNVLVSGVTIKNGVTGKNGIRASGIRIGEEGKNAARTGLSVVSNCVVTSCKNNYYDAALLGNNSGAVCVYNNGLLVDSTVADNSATKASAGVVVYGGEVRGCAISGNSAVYGGGMFVVTNATAKVADCTITGNTATESGGGVYVTENASATLTGCSVSENKATSTHGGGVFLAANAAATLTNCTVSANTAAKVGGGVFLNTGAEATLADCTISGNEAVSYAAGVFVQNTASATLTGCTVSENKATSTTSYGGGVSLATGAAATLTNCTVSANTATKEGGGAYVNTSATATVADCTFSGNKAGYGGGLKAKTGSTLKCVDCRFTGNTAPTQGGAMSIEGTCNAEIVGTVFDGNKMTNNSGTQACVGGAVAVSNQTAGASLMVSNCVFRNNSSSQRGGAFSGTWPGPVYAELVDCVFTNNTAYRNGGAVCVNDNGPTDTTTRFRMRNCLVARNKTTLSANNNGADGAGIYMNANANPVLESCTIVYNTTPAKSVGAGLYHHRTGTVKNCIIAYNKKGTSNESGSTWCLGGSSPVTDAYQYCCVYPALSDVFLSANHCLNLDPKFTNAAAGDYTLSSGSKCRDNGYYEDWMAGARDLAGLRRISGSTVDIGCYEFFRQPGLAIIVR